MLRLESRGRALVLALENLGPDFIEGIFFEKWRRFDRTEPAQITQKGDRRMKLALSLAGTWNFVSLAKQRTESRSFQIDCRLMLSPGVSFVHQVRIRYCISVRIGYPDAAHFARETGTASRSPGT